MTIQTVTETEVNKIMSKAMGMGRPVDIQDRQGEILNIAYYKYEHNEAFTKWVRNMGAKNSIDSSSVTSQVFEIAKTLLETHQETRLILTLSELEFIARFIVDNGPPYADNEFLTIFKSGSDMGIAWLTFECLPDEDFILKAGQLVTTWASNNGLLTDDLDYEQGFIFEDTSQDFTQQQAIGSKGRLKPKK